MTWFFREPALALRSRAAHSSKLSRCGFSTDSKSGLFRFQSVLSCSPQFQPVQSQITSSLNQNLNLLQNNVGPKAYSRTVAVPKFSFTRPRPNVTFRSYAVSADATYKKSEKPRRGPSNPQSSGPAFSQNDFNSTDAHEGSSTHGTSSSSGSSAESSSRRTYYEVLGLHWRDSATLTPQQLKAAYFKRAKEVHPDLGKAANNKADFQELQRAYACLSDPVKREKYDRAGFKDFDNMSREEIIETLKNQFGPIGRVIFGRLFNSTSKSSNRGASTSGAASSTSQHPGQSSSNEGHQNFQKLDRRLVMRGLFNLTVLYVCAWCVFSIPMALLVGLWRLCGKITGFFLSFLV